jgi:hypothetical protein
LALSSTGLASALGTKPKKAQAVICHFESDLLFNPLFNGLEKIAVELPNIPTLLAD